MEKFLIPYKQRSFHSLALIIFTFVYVFTPLLNTISNENPLHYLNYFADDFYYYLKIAGNIVDNGISSFDGITRTNGYHPLWMLIIVLILKLCGGANPGFFASLLFIKFTAGLMTFHLFRKITGGLYKETYFSLAIVWLAFLTSLMISDLMEVVITIPLLALLVLFIQKKYDELPGKPREMITLGFMASLVILSRLDAVIFVIIYLSSYIFISFNRLKKALVKLVYFGLGGILFPVYLAINKLYFHNFLPTSGQAKQLKAGIGPTFNVIGSIFMYRSPFLLIIQLTFILILAAILLVLLDKKTRWFPGFSHRVVFPALLFPPLLYLNLDILSDWPIWYWYFYPLPLAFLISALITGQFLARLPVKVKINVPPKYVYILFLSFLFLYPIQGLLKGRPETRFVMAGKIKEFANANKGIYTMGDSAGFISFFTGLPLIQLEGITADQEMIEHIRRQDNLLAVLKEYGAGFYIAKNPRFENGVYYFAEPVMGGEYACKMRAEFHSPPVYSFNVENMAVKVFKIETQKIPPWCTMVPCTGVPWWLFL